MKDKLLLIQKHLKQGTLRKMWAQSKWILQYGRRYWKSMVLYTLLGIAGSGVSLISSLISRIWWILSPAIRPESFWLLLPP